MELSLVNILSEKFAAGIMMQRRNQTLKVAITKLLNKLIPH